MRKDFEPSLEGSPHPSFCSNRYFELKLETLIKESRVLKDAVQKLREETDPLGDEFQHSVDA
jgi:DNA-directed RNA polymerase subunit L